MSARINTYCLIIWMSLLSFGTISCSNWLDVEPKSEIKGDVLFETEQGFEDAITGVYILMTDTRLYGKEMSYGFIEAVAQQYEIDPLTNNYFDCTQYRYDMDAVLTRIDGIWSVAYNAIANVNNILKNLETSSCVTPPVYARIKGECLGLRAFLHFDMLRLFGPVYKLNPKAESIPYNETSKVMALPLLAADSVIHEKVLRDLDEAESLLADSDPVIEGGPMASLEDDQDVYLRYRQLRMNYYAVLALKARVYLYAGEPGKALEMARKLLADAKVNEHFPAVDPNKLLANQSNPDRVFSTEVLAGIYKKDRKDIYTGYFDSEQAGNNYLHPRKDFVNTNLFAGETQDYRFQTWWQVASGVGESGHVFIKYKGIDKPTGDTEAEYFYAVFMSLIRLSEVYYIAAESEPVLADKYEWLNRMRTRRGLPVLGVVSEEDFMKRLRMEYLREFLGEGQIFYLYKRLNKSMYNGAYPIEMTGKYVVPLPDSETITQ